MISIQYPKVIQSGKLYWYGLWGGANRVLIPNDPTIQQMKSSGSLRFFAENSLVEKVTQYEHECRRIQSNEEKNNCIYVEVTKNRNQLFEFKYNVIANDIYRANKVSFILARIDSFVNPNPPLLAYDKTIFNQYAELVRSRYIQRNVANPDTLLVHATSLIEHLKKEYHLELEAKQ